MIVHLQYRHLPGFKLWPDVRAGNHEETPYCARVFVDASNA
jgi:hypothetical protein